MTNTRPFPFTHMDYVILCDLAHREESPTFRELAEDIGYSTKSVWHAVQKMIGRGLLDQSSDPHNERALSRSIVITDEGRRAVRAMDYLYEIVDQTQSY